MSTATEDGNLKNEIEGRDLKAIIKNVDSTFPLSPFSSFTHFFGFHPSIPFTFIYAQISDDSV